MSRSLPKEAELDGHCGKRAREEGREAPSLDFKSDGLASKTKTCVPPHRRRAGWHIRESSISTIENRLTKVEGGLHLDIIARERATILKLLSSEGEAQLVERNV